MKCHALIFCISAIVNGCTTNLTHQKLENSKLEDQGFSYYLPKQSYTLKIDYELKGCPAKRSPMFAQTVTLSEESIADPSEHYFIPLATLTSGWKTTSLSVETYSNKTLHTFGAEADDKTGEVLKTIVSIATGIATTTLSAPLWQEGKPVPMECSEDAKKLLSKIKKEKDSLETLTDQKKIEVATAKILNYRDKLKFDQTYSFEPTTKNLSFQETPLPEAYESLIKNPQHADFVAYPDSLKTEVKILAPLTNDEPAAMNDNDGIIFRDPAFSKISICTPDCKLKENTLSESNTQISQLGQKVRFSLKNGPFMKNNLSLTFSEIGRLEKATYGNESTVDKALSAANGAESSISDYVQKSKSANQADKSANSEVGQLKASNELTQAKIDKIKAEAELQSLLNK